MIYSADLEKLKSKQRQASADQDRHVPMVEIIRALLEAAEQAGEGA